MDTDVIFIDKYLNKKMMWYVLLTYKSYYKIRTMLSFLHEYTKSTRCRVKITSVLFCLLCLFYTFKLTDATYVQ